jgi:SecD/SecF fusion protein
VASGTYSSIFIAAPVLVHWKEREPVWKRRERIVREDHGGIVPAYSDAALGDESAQRGIVRRERPARRTQARGGTVTQAPPATTEDSGNGASGDGDVDGAPPEPTAPPESPRREQRPKPKPRSSTNRKRRRHGR